MTLYMKKSPIYYVIHIQGFKNEFGWYLSNEDEIDEFAKKFDMDWHWNMRTGVLSFEDKSKRVKLNRPEHVQIGDVVAAYDEGGSWCGGIWWVHVWTSEEFEKQFIRIEQ